MPLGMEVTLGPGDIVLDGVAGPLKGAQPPVFGPWLLWPNGWMDEDWAEVYFRTKWRLRPSSRLATIDMNRKLGAVPL